MNSWETWETWETGPVITISWQGSGGQSGLVNNNNWFQIWDNNGGGGGGGGGVCLTSRGQCENTSVYLLVSVVRIIHVLPSVPYEPPSIWLEHLAPSALTSPLAPHFSAPEPQVQVQPSLAALQTFVIKQVEPDPPVSTRTGSLQLHQSQEASELYQAGGKHESCDLTLSTSPYILHLIYLTLCTSPYVPHLMYLTLCTSPYVPHLIYLTSYNSPWSKGFKLSSLSATKAAAAIKLVHSISDGFQEPSN